MANPFFVEPANPLQALMLGKQGFNEAQQSAARRSAEEALKAGDTQGTIARLIGGGASKDAMALSQYLQSANTVYGTPVYGKTATGEMGIGTFDKQGNFKLINTSGFTPTPGIGMLDVGTGYVPYSKRTGELGPVGVPQAGQMQPGTGQPSVQPGIAPQAGGGVMQGPGGYVAKDIAGEAAQKVQGSEQAKNLAEIGAAKARLGGLTAGIDNLINTATRIKQSPALERITGVYALFPNYPSGKAANVQGDVDTLISQIAYTVLQNMRELSKTGGAVGNVSNYETQLLSNNLAAIKQLISASKYRESMDLLIEYGKAAKQRLQDAYDQDYGRLQKSQSQQPAPQSMQTQTSGPKVKNLGGVDYYQIGDKWYVK